MVAAVAGGVPVKGAPLLPTMRLSPGVQAPEKQAHHGSPSQHPAALAPAQCYSPAHSPAVHCGKRPSAPSQSYRRGEGRAASDPHWYHSCCDDFYRPRKEMLYSHLVLRWVQHAHQLPSQHVHNRSLLDGHCPPHQHRLYHLLKGCPLPQLHPLTLLFQPVRLQAHGVAPSHIPFYSAVPAEACKPSTQKTISCFRCPGV